MENENIGRLDALIQEAEESLEQADEDTKPQFEERLTSLNSLKEEFVKSKELSENQKIRAEKAEEKLKEKEKEAQPPKTEEGKLSQADLLYLAKADVHADDIDELVTIAKNAGKSVRETLQQGWVKSYLAEKQEERKTAEASVTKTKGMGRKSSSGEELLAKAEKGELPDKPEDIDKLVDAQLARKAGK